MRSITLFPILILMALAFPANGQNIQIYKAKRIYLCDTTFTWVEAMAVSGDRILLTGTLDSALKKYPGATVVNYGKQFIYPGLIDAHCHYYGTAIGMNECNVIGTKSEADVIKRLKKFAKSSKRTWLVGRGWDQNDWPGGKYPTIEALDNAFPDRPVFLKRIDGHAAWINTAAMKAAGIDPAMQIPGGQFVFENGKFTGILIDNAVDEVSKKIPEIATSDKITSLKKLEQQCFSYGLTTLDDAGLPVKDVLFLDSLQRNRQLQIRLYAMLQSEPETYRWISQNGIYKTPQMHVSAVKFYLDGALGSRGALMKKPYCDQPGHTGLLLTPIDEFTSYSHFLFTSGFQSCVHAIGDSANKIALKTFKLLLPPGMDMRWRIEHAQILDPADYVYFKDRSIIPSIQPTHATSDAPWAEKRICTNRMAGAYAYESLRKQAGILALGTDFPVEDISPLKTFYSATTRMDAAGILKTPFLPQQALSRRDALLGMTIWAAIANLEDAEKGSLETGKLADFVVMNQDLLQVPDKKIMKTKVVATYLGNTRVYKK